MQTLRHNSIIINTIIIVIIILLPPAQSLQAEVLSTVSIVGILLVIIKSSHGGDRITKLYCNWNALKKVSSFRWFLRNDGDASADIFNCITSLLIPRTCCIIIFSPPTQSQQAEDIVVKAKWPQRRLFGGESAAEGDRILPLQSHWQPLEQEACLPWIISDGCESTAQLLLG